VLKLYKAALDISHDSKEASIVVAGGFLSDIDQWDRLEPDWNSILAQEGVADHRGARYLHMKDLVSARKCFVGWDESKRRQLLSRLGTLLRVRCELPVARGVARQPYAEAVAILGSVGQPWISSDEAFSVFLCLNAIAMWCDDNNVFGERIVYVFEDGDACKPEVGTLMRGLTRDPGKKRAYRIAGWSFGGKTLVPLQAADWAAYEAHLLGKRELLPEYGLANVNERPRRASARLLFDRDGADLKFVTTRDNVLGILRSHMKRQEEEAKA
jgi:hypothetical protein